LKVFLLPEYTRGTTRSRATGFSLSIRTSFGRWMIDC